ncbi:MAG: transketolase [Desulfobulbaceae bacterium]|jgi:transketolase|nr:transketolase [Desulfobulbaceae bacterium]MDY0350944.1 transketolase [Desulfobulbaceae bacterium]
MALQLDVNNPRLSPEEISSLGERRKRCARRILLATTLAASGHPGGSLSALDLLLVTYGMIRHDPRNPRSPERDRVVISMGHISPGVYSTLAEYGYFTEDDFLSGFRRAGSGFPGHVESVVPGVEWDTGNLGQGLSAAVGMALAFKIKGRDNRVICLMGDGEHQKGQVAEALRFARKFRLDNLTVLIDRNHLQICGDTEVIMPQSIRGLYSALGWQVKYLADGHDCNSIFTALTEAYRNRSGTPTVIVARTIMGKGISFMENLAKYHGAPLNREQLAAALEELGVVNDLEQWEQKRREPVRTDTIMPPPAGFPEVQAGTPILYAADAKTDNRSAYGNALQNLAEANNIAGRAPMIIGVSCDLEGSVKMGGFRKHCPDSYCEAGIQEHHAAGMSGALSREELVTFFSTFGSFAVSEAYNQNRLSDFNHTNLKIVATHVGLDVGEDGPTHQCIDYLGLMKNYFRFSVFMPADPNQTDRIIRYIATHPGNHFVGMGRSKTPVITDENGGVFFDAEYRFVPGRADWLRRGTDLTIVTYGSLVPAAIEASVILKENGISAGVLNMASLLPIDEAGLVEAASIGPVLTVEDHHVESGLGASAAVVFMDRRLPVAMKRLGVGHYGSSGKPRDLYADQGLDPRSIASAAQELLGR